MERRRASEDGEQPSPSQPQRSPDDSKDDKVEERQEAPVAKVSLKPPDMVFQRTLMLRIWQSHKERVHPQLSGLTTGARPCKKGAPVLKKGRGPRSDRAPDEKQLFGKVRSLLGKTCPDNWKMIVTQLAQFDLKGAQELDLVSRIIFEKALAKPHWCETYADMVFALSSKYPEFPAEHRGEKAQTFTGVLLDICQTEFENLQVFDTPKEELANLKPEDYPISQLMVVTCKKKKDKMLANMKFIGNLFLRQLLAVKVIGQVVYELIGIKDVPPEEHKIECVCELLTAIGHELDDKDHGRKLMLQFTARLLELKRSTTADQKAMFSKRVQFQIQDLLDLRQNNWQKKMFKETAKKTAEIRKDAASEAREKNKRGMGAADVMFSTQIAGQRPAYIDDLKKEATRAPRPKEPSSSKVTWDPVYVKKLFAYFCEEKNGSELATNWKEGSPNSKEAKMAIETLLDIGFSEKTKGEQAADTLVELVSRRCLDWQMLDEALTSPLETLQDSLIDLPFCDVFIQVLLAKLLIAVGRDFNGAIFTHMPQDSDFTWGLLCGTLRRVKDRSGAETVRKLVADIPHLQETLSKAKSCSSGEMMKKLREEISL